MGGAVTSCQSFMQLVNGKSQRLFHISEPPIKYAALSLLLFLGSLEFILSAVKDTRKADIKGT